MRADLIRSGLLSLKVKAIDKNGPGALQAVVTTGRDTDCWHQISFLPCFSFPPRTFWSAANEAQN